MKCSICHCGRMSSTSRQKHGFHVILTVILVVGLVPILVVLTSEITSSSSSMHSPNGGRYDARMLDTEWLWDDAVEKQRTNVKTGDMINAPDHELSRNKVNQWNSQQFAIHHEKSGGPVTENRPRHRQTFSQSHPDPHPVPIVTGISPPVLREKLGNYEPRDSPKRVGLGEQGLGVRLNLSESAMYERSISEYGFNMVVSDRISLDRTVADLRDKECKHWHYATELPTTSVVIVFHNEGWSTLLRTVHSIFNTSPARLLAEVILVDDCSEKAHLKDKLEQYFQGPRFSDKVRIVRNKNREGLIRSRTIGARVASGQVVTFLDAHCECGINWLPPLLAEIALNRTTVVCPTVDAISADTFVYTSQGDGLCRGAFDWDFWYKRIPVVKSWNRLGLKHITQPYPSPVMAGGLFAMDRTYFFQLGGYDPGLRIWGGENFEISFKAWMCGGSLKFVPCSRVGHIYRKHVPYTYPSSGIEGASVVDLNYMRVAEVWLDEYKNYFYATKPQLESKSCGNIDAQVAFRREHCPKSFKWFMEEIAFDTLEEYPPPARNKIWGEIRSLDSELCLDTNGAQDESVTAVMALESCHGLGGNQLFRINTKGQLVVGESICLYPSSRSTSSELIFVQCTTKKKSLNTEYTIWDYDQFQHRIHLGNGKRCLDHNPQTNQVFVSHCIEGASTQEFNFYKEGIR